MYRSLAGQLSHGRAAASACSRGCASPAECAAPAECRLSDMSVHHEGVVLEADGSDVAVRRLQELGFVSGAPIRVVAVGPFRQSSLVVLINGTKFALRSREARQIRIGVAAPAAIGA